MFSMKVLVNYKHILTLNFVLTESNYIACSTLLSAVVYSLSIPISACRTSIESKSMELSAISSYNNFFPEG